MNMDEYRHRKEVFVSNLTGTSLYETGCIIINTCATYFLLQILKSSISSFQKYSLTNFLFEHVILVLPMIFVLTIWSSISYIQHLVIWIFAFVIYFLKNPSRKPTEQIKQQQQQQTYSRIIENFRGQILLATCICILAVDFRIFPRRYAKTENYGYSIMDLGVGLFALAHGMVSSEARHRQTSLRNLFLENLVLALLGLIRFLSVKYFSYVEHVSEYGVHWNFFLTLCFMKLLGNCLFKLTTNVPILILITISFHEGFLLRYCQFDRYLTETNLVRVNFLDANREGIYSLGGYVCLYLIGIFMGRLILKYESQARFQRMTIQFLLGMIFLCGISTNASRKLCNLSYISSTTGLACLCLAGFSLIHWLLEQKNLSIESNLLKNINQKGLDLFLLANVLTGLINLNVNTLDASNELALGLICLYMFIVTLLAYFCASVIKFILGYLRLTKN